MIQKGIEWIRNHVIDNEGIAVSSRRRIAYPEVTGYLIPTLQACGEHQLARDFALWLVHSQRDDGAFSPPEGDQGYAFDTGQVIRGWVALASRLPELEEPLRRACAWMVNQASSEGRLPVPTASWGLGRRGSISEAVHLYALVPLIHAGKLLNEPHLVQFARTSAEYYLRHTEATEFERSNMLSHFYCYIQEALFDLGFEDRAAEGMRRLAPYQGANGLVSGYADVPWVCTPGHIQAAIVWYKLGEFDRADQALEAIGSFMMPSGGFLGSYGAGAEYFANEEISWATKFYLDAAWTRIERFFDKHQSIFPDSLARDDGRLKAILRDGGSLDGARILDVGCGKGRFAACIKQACPGAEVWGLDVSGDLLSHVPSMVKTVQASMLDMPFEANTFDLVYCVEALEHAVRVDEALSEMFRVLRPGGRIVVIDKNARKWCSMKTPQWEQWFIPEKLTEGMKPYCEMVDWAFIDGDRRTASEELFVAWTGTKSGSDGMTVETNAVANHPVAASGRALDADQWHERITGSATPAQIAEKVSAAKVHEWVNVLLEETKPGDLVCELGCGTGELSAHLAKAGRQVVLVDYSQESLDFCREVFAEAGLSGRFVLADVTQAFPFETESFDVVWSSGLLEHFDDEQIVHILSYPTQTASCIDLASGNKRKQGDGVGAARMPSVPWSPIFSVRGCWRSLSDLWGSGTVCVFSSLNSGWCSSRSSRNS